MRHIYDFCIDDTWLGRERGNTRQDSLEPALLGAEGLLEQRDERAAHLKVFPWLLGRADSGLGGAVKDPCLSPITQVTELWCCNPPVAKRALDMELKPRRARPYSTIRTRQASACEPSSTFPGEPLAWTMLQVAASRD